MPDFSVNMHQIQFLAWPPPPAHMFPDLLVDLGERGGEREEEGRGREWGTEMESEGGEERVKEGGSPGMPKSRVDKPNHHSAKFSLVQDNSAGCCSSDT